jgi:hypothetical protein
MIKIRLRRHERASRADDPAWLTNERGVQHKDGKQNPPNVNWGYKTANKGAGLCDGWKVESILRCVADLFACVVDGG